MRVRPIASAVLLLASCGRCVAPPEASREAEAEAAASATAVADAAPDAAAAPRVDASVPEAEAAAAAEAGPSACRLVWGPAEQPFRGPAEMVATPSELRVVGNEDGRPRVFAVPMTAPPRAPAALPKPVESAGTMRWPPCAIAGPWAYCQAKGGTITRTTMGASDAKTVAKSHGGTPIAAATLGEGRAVLAFLDTRKTSEGDRLQAFAVLDDGEPVRLSEDGAGANVVRLAPRGDGATAVYIDHRSGMLPVHARTVRAQGKDLALGPDAVLFLGGPPERGVDFALARGFVLVPMPKDITTFGVATIALGDPPKAEIGASWSLYPNGLDPAPIAASGSYVVRLRPGDATRFTPSGVAKRVATPEGVSPGSSRVVELGRLDPNGGFASFGSIADGSRATHLAITTDAHGAVWILQADPARTWLERRVCP